jgi:hypothetical protein
LTSHACRIKGIAENLKWKGTCALYWEAVFCCHIWDAEHPALLKASRSGALTSVPHVLTLIDTDAKVDFSQQKKKLAIVADFAEKRSKALLHQGSSLHVVMFQCLLFLRATVASIFTSIVLSWYSPLDCTISVSKERVMR